MINVCTKCELPCETVVIDRWSQGTEKGNIYYKTEVSVCCLAEYTREFGTEEEYLAEMEMEEEL